jgi:hypothetical protein
MIENKDICESCSFNGIIPNYDEDGVRLEDVFHDECYSCIHGKPDAHDEDGYTDNFELNKLAVKVGS